MKNKKVIKLLYDEQLKNQKWKINETSELFTGNENGYRENGANYGYCIEKLCKI